MDVSQKMRISYRWTLVSFIGALLVWCAWFLITGDVPVITAQHSLPDILDGPFKIAVLVWIFSLFFIFTACLCAEKGERPSMGIVPGLVSGLVLGLFFANDHSPFLIIPICLVLGVIYYAAFSVETNIWYYLTAFTGYGLAMGFYHSLINSGSFVLDKIIAVLGYGGIMLASGAALCVALIVGAYSIVFLGLGFIMFLESPGARWLAKYLRGDKLPIKL